VAGAGGVWLEQEVSRCGWSCPAGQLPGSDGAAAGQLAGAAGVWLEQQACGWSRRRVAGAGGVWLEQQACNRLEHDLLAGATDVWLEQEACGWSKGVWLEQEACGWSSRRVRGAGGV
jgi:hypothetical protein